MDNELSKGFTGVEINGICFSNIGEMLRYMDKQRKQLTKAKEIIQEYYEIHSKIYDLAEDEELLLTKAETFLKEIEK